MCTSFNYPGDYRVEISGWGIDKNFFVERSELLWNPDGEKQVCLRRAMVEGSVVFVRLLGAESSNATVPVAYEIQAVTPMDCEGRCRMGLVPRRPRFKESREAEGASKHAEGSRRVRNVQEDSVAELQHEEVLR